MCDLLCALAPAAADGLALFAKNSDRPPTEPQVVEWHPPRREDATTATYVTVPGHRAETFGVLGSRPTWMWGMEHGVNTAAVAIGNATIFTTLDPRGCPAALTGMDLVRLGLERSGSASEAVAVITALLERHGQGGSGQRFADRPYWSSFLIVDPTEAFVVETSGRTSMTEEVTLTRSISNRTTIPAFDAQHRHPRQPVATLVDPRLDASRSLLAREAPVTSHALREHLRSHVGGADGWTVCMHVDGIESTTASMVATLPDPADGAPLARVLLGSPCRSIYVPLVVGHPVGDLPPWERFATLSESSRPVLAALEAELDESVAGGADGSDRNANASRQVTELLDRLST